MATTTSNSLEELRKFWEVPAVAHFCSLFRSVFKLIDFDIEDFEEALIVDTESAAEGGRSSLIVDVLIALIRGCLGRKDVTLLNYNEYLYDLLQFRWLAAGLGENPLGPNRDRACFHILPLYPKIKILHYLCEWRLERPDVEVITRNFSGDYLRVIPMGNDDNGLTYWYFYGTRLYSEEEELKLKITNPNSSKKRKKSDSESTLNSPVVRAKRRKRRKRQSYDMSGAKRRKKRVSPRKQTPKEETLEKDDETSDSSDEDVKKQENDLTTDQTVNDSDRTSASASTSSPTKKKLCPGAKIRTPSPQQCDESSKDATPREVTKLKSSTTDEQRRQGQQQQQTSTPNVSGRSSPTNSSTTETELFRAMVNRIYSRDEDEEDDEEEMLDEDDDRTTTTSDKFSATATNDVSQDSFSCSTLNKIKEETKMEIENEETTSSATIVADEKIIEEEKQPSVVAKKEEQEEQQTNVNSNNNKFVKKPYIPVGPPPWDQNLLRTPEHSRWRLVCYTLDDWRVLTQKYSQTRSKCEKELYKILHHDFLPAIEKLFEEAEKEKQRKLAELAPRRMSDRLEVKRLQKEREDKLFAEREAAERERLTKIDDEKRRKIEQERREQRVKLRELEREKRNLIRNRAREDRSKRLELRKKRQQLMSEGKEIPADLLNATGGMMTDVELEELDTEIELEHMYGQLEKLIDYLQSQPDAQPFLMPVSEEIAPDYKDIIETPMDLETIEDKLLDREFKCKAEFIKAINLMLLNCLQYNGIYSEYVKIAARLERVFIKAWKRFFPPSDLEEFSERARQEELDCISLLGALDRAIKEEIARINAESAAAKTQEIKKRCEARRSLVRSTFNDRGVYGTGGYSDDNNKPTVRKVVEEGVVSGPIESTHTPAIKTAFANRISAFGSRTPVVLKQQQQLKSQSPQAALAKGILLEETTSSPRFGGRQPPTLRRESNESDVGSLQETILLDNRPVSSTKGPISAAAASSSAAGQQVYALQSRTGTRFCKFVDTNGVPATPEMVNQAMPILKNCIQQLPKGLSTVTISISSPDKKTSSPIEIEQPRHTPVITTKKPTKPPNVQRREVEATTTTSTIVRKPTTSIVRTSAVASSPFAAGFTNKFDVANKLSSAGLQQHSSVASPTSSSSVAMIPGGITVKPSVASPTTAGRTPIQIPSGGKRLIQVNEHWYCQLSDGSACLLRKDPTTGALIVSSEKMSKEDFTKTLLQAASKSNEKGTPATLKMILPSVPTPFSVGNVKSTPSLVTSAAQQRPQMLTHAIQQKPVCSVAPLPQVKAIRPNNLPSVLRQPTPVPVVIQQQQQQTQTSTVALQSPTGTTAQAIVLSDGQQLVLTPAQVIVSGSYLVTGPTGAAATGQPVVLTSAAQQQPMQVIQVVPQQIVVNRTAPSSADDSTTNRTAVVIQQTQPVTATTSTSGDNVVESDLLALAWQSVDSTTTPTTDSTV